MAWTARKIAQDLRAGRGAGDGADYVPWLQVEDLPRSSRNAWSITRYNWSP